MHSEMLRMSHELREIGYDVPFSKEALRESNESRDATRIGPEQHHHIALDQRNGILIKDFLAAHVDDPATEVYFQIV